MTGLSARFVLFVQLASTLFMVGVIWFVQVVHYPMFAKAGAAEFPSFEESHRAATTWVVAAPMLLEAGSALLLVWRRPAGVTNFQIAVGLALIAVVWLSTVFLQIPCHDGLSRGFDSSVHRQLLLTNWVRTISWSVRGVLVLAMVWTAGREERSG